MVIDGGYYISERTSRDRPYAYIDSGTLYIPFNIDENKDEEGGYAFREYRITVPISDSIPIDILKQIIGQIPDVMDAINETLISIFGESATIKNSNGYKSAIDAVKEKITEENDKTLGIACRAIFPVYVQNKQHDSGEVATHPETGYPYECMTAYDGSVQQDWTIDNRTLWKPWHSRKAEYALPWEAPTGAHDMYKEGEFMIWTDGVIKKALRDTNFSPDEYPSDWEDA